VRKSIVLLVLVVGVSLGPAQAPWQQFGPHGATVAAMTTVPGFANDIYFMPDGFPARLYYSSNLGLSWSVRETIPDLLNALAVDPTQVQVMYAAGHTRRVYRSVNSGSSWQVQGTLAQDAWIRQIMVNPQRSTVLWASADLPGADIRQMAAFHSTNAGATWTPSVLDSSFEVSALLLSIDASRPHRAFVGGSVGNVARLFTTGDGGTNWTDISAGLGGTCAYGLAVSPTDSMTLMCATDAGLYRSTNMGAAWTRAGSFPAFSVAFARANPYTGYAGSDYLVFRSDNNGVTWAAETTTFVGTNTRWLSINPDLPLEVYVGNGRGIFHSSDGGFDWQDRTPSTPLLSMPTISFFPPGPETAFAPVRGNGVLTSTDRGIHWTELGRFPGIGFATGAAANPRHPETLLVVTANQPRVYMTTDRGDSWVSFNIADNFQPGGVSYHPAGPDTLYTWGGKRDSASGPTRLAVFRSSNQGQTWSLSVTTTGTGTCRGFLAVATGETLYAWGSADNRATLLRSGNHGQNWAAIAPGLSGTEVHDFTIGPDTNLLFCATSSGVYRSQNNGTSWIRLGLANVSAVLPDTLSAGRLWAGTDTEGVYFTNDAGLNWVRDTVNLTARTVLSLQGHPAIRSAVYLSAAGAGLFGRGVISVTEPGPRPPERRLLAVTPTVARGRVLFTVDASSCPAQLNLYSADGRLGRRIARLLPGSRSLTWDVPRDLPTGAYVIRYESTARQATAKLLVSRSN